MGLCIFPKTTSALAVLNKSAILLLITLQARQAAFGVSASVDEIRVIQSKLNSSVEDVVNSLDSLHETRTRLE